MKGLQEGKVLKKYKLVHGVLRFSAGTVLFGALPFLYFHETGCNLLDRGLGMAGIRIHEACMFAQMFAGWWFQANTFLVVPALTVISTILTRNVQDQRRALILDCALVSALYITPASLYVAYWRTGSI